MTDETYQEAKELKEDIAQAEEKLGYITLARKEMNPLIKIGTNSAHYFRITKTTLETVLDKEEYIWGNFLKKYKRELKEL